MQKASNKPLKTLTLTKKNLVRKKALKNEPHNRTIHAVSLNASRASDHNPNISQNTF